MLDGSNLFAFRLKVSLNLISHLLFALMYIMHEDWFGLAVSKSEDGVASEVI